MNEETTLLKEDILNNSINIEGILPIFQKYENLLLENVELKNDKVEKNKLNGNIATLLMKIQNIKVELQKKELKKSGFNSFSKFHYYTLEDFLPAVNELCLKYKVYLKEDFENIKDGIAAMTAIDCDDINNQYVVTIPTAPVDLKGGNAIQNIASQITYSRRHLYLVLFGIVEADTVDATSGEDEKPKKTKITTKPAEDDDKTKLKKLCTELSSKGKQKEVQDILMEKAKVRNPNSIKDEKVIEELIIELNKLEA